jgi:hypothetical protein
MIQKATVRAQQVRKHFGLGPEYTPRLALLSLYDFVILCGKSRRLTKSTNPNSSAMTNDL